MNSVFKYLLYLLAVLIVSFFFFPFEFTFLPGYNTKKVMAVIGLCIALIELAKKKNLSLDKDIVGVALFACIVSLVGFFSCTFNHTYDYTYASYIMSFLVWISAAYVCVYVISELHGKVDFTIIANYVIAAGIFQCISAILIDSIPAVKGFVDSHVINIFDAASRDRMYGIGASLDVAGTKFAVILLLITAVLHKNCERLSNAQITLYLVSYCIIVIIGNMIGRTTTVGIIVSILYIIFIGSININNSIQSRRILSRITLLIAISSILCVWLYNNNPSFHDNVRFGFEGFFSIAETGKWSTNSNEHLSHMLRFPDTIKTWIIGDGYFEGAANDVNFLGDPTMTNYYMRTDIGYCRFIFYFGVVGLLCFMGYFIKCAIVCAKHLHEYNILFVLLLLLNFIIWVKVSSDIFPIFALALCTIQMGSPIELDISTDNEKRSTDNC